MVGEIKFRVEGLAEIQRALTELGTAAANRIARSALNRSATPVVKAAKEKVPVRTGELKRAITKRLRRQRRGSDKQTAVIGIEKPTSRRAHFAEFGTRFAAATPFLRPALDERQDEVLRIMQQGLRDGIQTATSPGARP